MEFINAFTLRGSNVFDVCAAPRNYPPLPPASNPATTNARRTAETAGILRGTLGRVDAALATLRALGAEAARDELRRSLRDLLAVDEGRHD